MKKALFLAALAAFSAGCAGVETMTDTPGAAEKTQGAAFYPLDRNRTWIYTGTVFGWFPYTVVMKVADVVEVDGVPVTVIAARAQHAFATTDTMLYVANSDKGVVLYRMDHVIKAGGSFGGKLGFTEAFNPPRPIGPNDSKAGEARAFNYALTTGNDPLSLYFNKFGSWGQTLIDAAAGKLQDKDIPVVSSATMTYQNLGPRHVTTALGSFDTVAVKAAGDRDNQYRVEYFAPGVGMVLQEVYLEGKTEPTSVLTLVNTHPDYADKFFYPAKLLGLIPRKAYDYKGRVSLFRDGVARLFPGQ